MFNRNSSNVVVLRGREIPKIVRDTKYRKFYNKLDNMQERDYFDLRENGVKKKNLLSAKQSIKRYADQNNIRVTFRENQCWVEK